MHSNKFNDISQNKIYLDDLIIKNGAFLKIRAWQAGRDHFLVRKDSKHLEDALKKLTIDGWAKNQIYKKSYVENGVEYWSIEAAPEPATYGAVLVSVGAVGLRRRRKSSGCDTQTFRLRFL